MRHILRRRERVEDGAERVEAVAEPLEDGADPLVIPFAEFFRDPASWRAHPGPLGVRVSPADNVDALAADIARFAIVVVEFPTFNDGRGYSHGRILRTRLNFQGEMRATGVVKQDHLFFMARCGFDSFELAPGENVEEAKHALRRFTVAYQPGDSRVPIALATRYP